MRLILLAHPDAAVTARMRRWRADGVDEFSWLVAGVAPALIVVGNRPAAIQMPPDRRVGVGQGLRADLADESRIQPAQLAPVALRPADVAVNVLVATGCHDGPRAVQLAQ